MAYTRLPQIAACVFLAGATLAATPAMAQYYNLYVQPQPQIRSAWPTMDEMLAPERLNMERRRLDLEERRLQLLEQQMNQSKYR